MEKKMELAKFLVKTENFDEIHVYVHGEKAVSVAESLAGNSCYAENSGMWLEPVSEKLVFVTLFPETSIGEAIATLGKLGFADLYAQVCVGVQTGPCHEKVFPITGVFEIPNQGKETKKMKKVEILNVWGSQGNEFYDPSAANNGGGYDQPYGGMTARVGKEHLYIYCEDNSCGDYGCRYEIAISAVERGMKWTLYFNPMERPWEECEKALERWESDKRSIAGVMKITLDDVNTLIQTAWDAVKICVGEECWRKNLEFEEWQCEAEEAHKKWWADEENLKWWAQRCAEWRKETHEMFGN